MQENIFNRGALLKIFQDLLENLKFFFDRFFGHLRDNSNHFRDNYASILSRKQVARQKTVEEIKFCRAAREELKASFKVARL